MRQLTIEEIKTLTDFQKRLKLGLVTTPTPKGKALLMTLSLDVEDVAAMPIRDLASYLAAYNNGLPVEVVSRAVRESDPLIERYGRRLWSDMSDPDSKYYIGTGYLKQADKTYYQLEGRDLIASFPSQRELDAQVLNYLETRSGTFIKTMNKSGRNEVRRLLVESYKETGTISAFDKKMREEFSLSKKWKREQIYVTEHGQISNAAYFNIADQIEAIDGFDIILGPSPCVFCQFEASYTHDKGEDRPPYHVSCCCLPAPAFKGEKRNFGRRVDADPLQFMKPNEYARLTQNYADFIHV